MIKQFERCITVAGQNNGLVSGFSGTRKHVFTCNEVSGAIDNPTHNFADCITDYNSKPCISCAQYAFEMVGV